MLWVSPYLNPMVGFQELNGRSVAISLQSDNTGMKESSLAFHYVLQASPLPGSGMNKRPFR